MVDEAILGRDRRGYCTYKLVNYSSRDKCSYIRYIPCLSHSYFLAAKHGWVLVAWPAEDGRVLKAMFYDPFSLTTIDLPTLNNLPCRVSYCQLNKQRNIFRFDFSAPATSPECKVVAFFTATCSRGQAAWTSADHRGFDCIWLPHRRMVFHRGSFYCIAGVKERHVVGKVLAFHPETNTVQGFSGHPDRAEAMAKRASIPMEKILCRRLRMAVAINVVERLADEELFPELRRRDHLVKVSKWRRQEGLAMLSNQSLGFPFPRIYRPLLWEDMGGKPGVA